MPTAIFQPNRSNPLGTFVSLRAVSQGASQASRACLDLLGGLVFRKQSCFFLSLSSNIASLWETKGIQRVWLCWATLSDAARRWGCELLRAYFKLQWGCPKGAAPQEIVQGSKMTCAACFFFIGLWSRDSLWFIVIHSDSLCFILIFTDFLHRSRQDGGILQLAGACSLFSLH